MLFHLFLTALLAIVLWRGGWQALVATPDTNPVKQWIGVVAVLTIIVSVLMFIF